MVAYTKYTLEYPEPSWTVMPLAGTSEAQWPPFTDERLLGRWFWDQYWNGTVVCLGGLIASTLDAVFWVDTQATLGSYSCAVSRDIRSSEGYTLRAGRYVYHQVLREGKSVPSLEMLLAEADKTDLSPRFRRSEYSDC